MNTTQSTKAEAFTVYSVQYVRTAGPRKGQNEYGVERTDGNGKFSAPRGYKVIAVREKVGQ